MLSGWALHTASQRALAALLRRWLVRRLEGRLRCAFDAWARETAASLLRGDAICRLHAAAILREAVAVWKAGACDPIAAVREHRMVVLKRSAFSAWVRCLESIRADHALNLVGAGHTRERLRRTGVRVLHAWSRLAQEARFLSACVQRIVESGRSRTLAASFLAWHRFSTLCGLAVAKVTTRAARLVCSAFCEWSDLASEGAMSRGRHWAASISLSAWHELALVALQAWASQALRQRAARRRVLAAPFMQWRFATLIPSAA